MRDKSNINYVEIPNKLKFLISLIAFFLILIHGLMPLAVIDSVTIALFIIAVFPWILSYIKNIKLPGGAEVEFRDAVERVEDLAKQSGILGLISKKGLEEIIEKEITPDDVLHSDPNLALAYFRIEIEAALRRLASLKEINFRRHDSAGNLALLLQNNEVINNNEYRALREFLSVANRAVHGEEVDFETASRFLDLGGNLLNFIDSKIREYMEYGDEST